MKLRKIPNYGNDRLHQNFSSAVFFFILTKLKFYDIIQPRKSINKEWIIIELGNLLFGHSRGNYTIDRQSFEKLHSEAFCALLEAVNCDSYGHYCGANKAFLSPLGGFQCDLFSINPYWWGECTCGYDEESDTQFEGHKDECALVVPNFKYKFDNGEEFHIRWYKYPFRDSYSNMPITIGLVDPIFAHCINYAKTLDINGGN